MKLLNFVLFQICWLGAVIGAGDGRGWIGPLLVALFASWQLTRRNSPEREWLLVALTGAAGLLVDTVWIQAGVLRYAAPGPWPEVAPLWIVALWVNLALTLNHCMAYLRNSPLVAAALGAVGGPLSYGAAIKGWQAAEPGVSAVTLTVLLAVAWALAVPALFALSDAVTRRPTRVAESST